jgi:hypothetical protein
VPEKQALEHWHNLCFDIIKKRITPPVSAFRTGRDAHYCARGLFFAPALRWLPQASNLQGNAEKRAFFSHFPVNKL